MKAEARTLLQPLHQCTQVFDCGLLGEGVLHILAAAQAKGMLAPGATIVPSAARV